MLRFILGFSFGLPVCNARPIYIYIYIYILIFESLYMYKERKQKKT